MTRKWEDTVKIWNAKGKAQCDSFPQKLLDDSEIRVIIFLELSSSAAGWMEK